MQVATPAKTIITYEQPLNDTTRICLRLENLFNQFHHHVHHHSLDSSKAAMAALLNAYNVVERPDLKSKLTQTLTQLASSLGQLEQFPQVDRTRLQSILTELDHHIKYMHGNRAKIGGQLQTNEFLKAIRQSMAAPGGTCDYNVPAYSLWLAQPSERRNTDLLSWAEEFIALEKMIRVILNLIRLSAKSQSIQCSNGFHQQNLDPNLPCEIIRIKIATDFNAYPEFSVGRHRLNIRFVEPNYYGAGRPTQVKQTLNFELSCCRF